MMTDKPVEDEEDATKVEVEEKVEEPEAPFKHLADDANFCTRLNYVLTKFFPLGWIAFGGPTAHIALLRERFVTDLKMLDEDLFLELFGLCQAMPGPTSYVIGCMIYASYVFSLCVMCVYMRCRL
jgi:hypothetical protein